MVCSDVVSVHSTPAAPLTSSADKTNKSSFGVGAVIQPPRAENISYVSFGSLAVIEYIPKADVPVAGIEGKIHFATGKYWPNLGARVGKGAKIYGKVSAQFRPRRYDWVREVSVHFETEERFE